MAEKKGKRKQDTAYCKEANTEFHTVAHNAFTGGGNAAYQPRDSGIGKPGHGLGGKRQTEKSMQAQQETFGQKVQKSEKSQPGKGSTFTGNKSMDSQSSDAGQRKSNHASKAHAKKQMYQTTSGQKVQKSDVKPEQEEKSDFVRESNAFTGQENFSQTEETGKKQPDTEDYHRRDTYRQSQKKGKYHKKRVQREHQNKGGTKEKAENKTFTEESFTENTGNLFQGEGDSEFTGSKKLQKKQRQAQKAAKKAQKARAKLPKTREYTLQRVFGEKTGKGKYVVVPLDREKPFKQEGIPKTTMTDIFGKGTELDDSEGVQTARKAKELLDKLAEYKPLAKIEELEECNYNMIDNVLNNEKPKEEKQAGRISIKEKLAEKKAVIEQRDKSDKEVPEKGTEKKSEREI